MVHSPFIQIGHSDYLCTTKYILQGIAKQRIQAQKPATKYNTIMRTLQQKTARTTKQRKKQWTHDSTQ